MGKFENSDVFIIGGGPAGLALAILARRRGFRVALADHAHPPIDKACGEGLMPDALAALGRMGMRFAPDDGVAFRGIRFFEPTTKAVVAGTFSGTAGIAIRRTKLHAKLIEHAAEAGVSLLWGARVSSIGNGEFECNGSRIESRWIVGADGENSQLRKWVAPEPPRYERVRFGCRQHFQMRPWTDLVEVYWGESCQIVVTPAGPHEVGVAVTSRSSHMKLAQALLQLPELAEKIAGAPVMSTERGARCALRILRRVHRGRLALIGDASGSVDPLTGEGLGLAFRQAAALVAAFARGNLHEYQAAHDRIARISRLMSKLMLLMDRNESFRHRVLRAFAAEPYLFSRLLDTHVEAVPLSAFGLAERAATGLAAYPAADGGSSRGPAFEFSPYRLVSWLKAAYCGAVSRGCAAMASQAQRLCALQPCPVRRNRLLQWKLTRLRPQSSSRCTMCCIPYTGISK